MADWAPDRHSTVRGLCVVALLAVLVVSGAGTATAQQNPEVTVTIEPEDVVLQPGENTTVDVVVTGADDGISVYQDLIVELDPTIARFVGFTRTRGGLDNSEIRNDGGTLELSAALLDDVHSPAQKIVVARATIEATNGGQTAARVSLGSVSDVDAFDYPATAVPGSVVVASPDPPVAALDSSPSPAEAGERVVLDAGGSTGGIVKYRWDFEGDDSIDATTTSPTATHTYDAVGEQTPTVTVEDLAGRTATARQTVTVREARPDRTAALRVVPSRPTTGETVTLDAGNSTGDITEYRWAFDGNGSIDATTTSPTTTHTYDTAGTRTTRVTVVDTAGRTATAEQTVTVEEKPNLTAALTATPTELQTGGSVTLDASDSTGDITEYRWEFDGNGSIDATTTSPTTTHTYDTAGTRTTRVTVVNAAGRTATAEQTVTVEEKPNLTAALTATPTELQTGGSVTLDASDSTGDITEYRWEFDGNGSIDATTTSPTTTHTYDTAGTRTARVTVVDAAGRTATAEQTVTVREPQSDVVVTLELTPTQPTAGESVTLELATNGSLGTVYGYRWDFDGDGSADATTRGPTTTHTYDTAGARTVQAEVVTPDATPSATQPVQVVDSPSNGDGEETTAALDVEPTRPTTGETLTLDAGDSTGDIREYEWDFDGDGIVDATTTSPTTTHTYDTAGTQTAVVTVTGPAGATSALQTIEVVNPPSNGDGGDGSDKSGNDSDGSTGEKNLTAALEVDTSQPTAGGTVVLNASGSTGEILGYRWDFDGDGSVDATTTGPTATHTYDTAGARTVEVIVISPNGMPNATRPVQIAEASSDRNESDEGDVTSGGNGSDGSDGTSGGDGSDGTSGGNGSDGSDGSDGTSGGDGSDGSGGVSDENGSDGSDGTSGGDGSDGTSGGNGSDGSDGTSDGNVTDGTDGTSGDNVTDGSDGSDGTLGGNGSDGSDGTSGGNGSDGSDGTSGENVTDGSNASGGENSSGDRGNTRTESSADGFGTGFGAGVAVAGLSGLGYLLRRRLRGDTD